MTINKQHVEGRPMGQLLQLIAFPEEDSHVVKLPNDPLVRPFVNSGITQRVHFRRRLDISLAHRPKSERSANPRRQTEPSAYPTRWSASWAGATAVIGVACPGDVVAIPHSPSFIDFPLVR